MMEFLQSIGTFFQGVGQLILLFFALGYLGMHYFWPYALGLTAVFSGWSTWRAPVNGRTRGQGALRGALIGAAVAFTATSFFMFYALSQINFGGAP